MPRTSHRTRIHETIRTRILNGKIAPDDRLVDTVIAAEMGVSRMPVREALMQLVSEGYLEGTSRGFSLPSLSRERVLGMFLLRRLLEPYAVASAAQARTEADLERMHSAFRDAEKTLGSSAFEPFFRASEAFRNAWLAAVPNLELREAIQRLSGQIQTVRLATMRDPEAHRAVIAGQRDLLESFIRRDALAAGDRTLRFVMEGEASYRRLNIDPAG
ncbi:MAG: GntR family transcriptional regulator [Pararhodobacter sp.]